MNIKKQILQDLKTKEIADICNKVYYLHAKEPTNKYIEYEILKRVYSNYSSNKPTLENIEFQVDLFSNNADLFELEEVVELVLKGKGYIFQDSFDMYEDDTKLYHIAIRFKIQKLIED